MARRTLLAHERRGHLESAERRATPSTDTMVGMADRPPPPHRDEFRGPEWLSVQQAATALGLTFDQAQWRIRRGQLPATRDRSSRWHVHHDDLDRIRAMDWYQESMKRKR